MSLQAVRTALQTALDGISPAIDAAGENAPYTPTVGVPYQQTFVMFAQPDNSEVGPAFTEQGIFQISLFYPKDQGAAAAIARAELIRTAFAKATSLTSGGVVVTIIATPEVAPARADDDRFLVPVKVRFQARISGG